MKIFPKLLDNLQNLKTNFLVRQPFEIHMQEGACFCQTFSLTLKGSRRFSIEKLSASKYVLQFKTTKPGTYSTELTVNSEKQSLGFNIQYQVTTEQDHSDESENDDEFDSISLSQNRKSLEIVQKPQRTYKFEAEDLQLSQKVSKVVDVSKLEGPFAITQEQINFWRRRSEPYNAKFGPSMLRFQG